VASAPFFVPSLALFLLAIPLGLLLDHVLGEPRRWHPLIGFGRAADALERALRRGAPGHPAGNRLRGVLAWVILVLPLPLLFAALLTGLLSALPWQAALAGHALLLWFALGGRSLTEHAEAVARPLAAGNLAEARMRLGWLVSRETTSLESQDIARATVETTLENGNDAIFGALFWCAVLGGPGALAFRFANTLDAMWGYRDERRRYFGWAAARADDMLNLIPARLTALTYALLGQGREALSCWRTQAGAWSSPNAGPVMAAGAGALGVCIGGDAVYHGRREVRPALGCGAAPTAADIGRALLLVQRGAGLWGGLALIAGVLTLSGALYA
jgi:adenosylcobinamide-phosphate synthase